MAKDILSYYGPDVKQSGSSAKGGICEAKPLPYSPPTGPKGIDHKSVGLGGTNYGNCGTQGKR